MPKAPGPSSLDDLIGARLRELREALGLTQSELASVFGSVGALEHSWGTRQTLSQAEQGKRMFSVEDLVGLAAYFGVPVLWFIAQPEKPSDYVRVGRVSLPLSDFVRFVSPQIPTVGLRRQTPMLDAIVPSGVIERFVGRNPPSWLEPAGLRPWALRSAELAEAYKLARHAIAKAKDRSRAARRYSSFKERAGTRAWGPTILAESAVSKRLTIPPFGMTLTLVLRRGERFTAEDKFEAQLARQAIEHGSARRVRAAGPGRKKHGGVRVS